MRIKADTNGPGNLPAADRRLHAAERVVTLPPPPPADPTPTPDADAAAEPTPQPDAAADPAADAESDAGHRGARPRSLKAASSKLKPNTALKLKATLSEGASLSVDLRARPRGPQGRQDVQGRRQEGQEVHA